VGILNFSKAKNFNIPENFAKFSDFQFHGNLVYHIKELSTYLIVD